MFYVSAVRQYIKYYVQCRLFKLPFRLFVFGGIELLFDHWRYIPCEEYSITRLHLASINHVQADRGNNRIRLLILSSSRVSTLAGLALNHGSQDGIGTVARFDQPWDVVLDATGSFALIVSRVHK